MPTMPPSLRIGSLISSPVSGRQYTIVEKIGEGGFGAAYRARRGRTQVCLKITHDPVSWHREAYMAELLTDHRRVVKVHETFPLVRRGHVSYAVAMELADGTVADAIESGPWTESKVVPQIRGLLTAVGQLHDSGALHRDITPFNVFCCGPNQMLKLGDFGLARHGFGRGGVKADAFAPWFVDSKLFQGSRQHWTIGDDLWQVGQVAAILLSGELEPIQTKEVRNLSCSDGLKLAIRRAIGEPWVRYSDARAMSKALLRHAPLSFGSVRSLRGRTVVFTGALKIRRSRATALAVKLSAPIADRKLVSIPRTAARQLAERAGARTLPSPNRAMDVLVVGSDSPNWVAGSAGGVKVLETLALQELGQRVVIMRAATFAKLVGLERR